MIPDETADRDALDTRQGEALRRLLQADESLEWIERMTPRQVVLSDLHIDLDYRQLEAETPAHVTPAFDGMQINVLTGEILNR